MTSLVDDIAAYLALTADDRARLVALHAVMAPEFPAIVDAFYDAAMGNAKTRALLGDPALVVRLRASLVDWLSTGLLGPYDDAFLVKRSRIGHRHVEIGLAQHFMITAMNVVRRAYRDRIVVAYPAAEAHAVGNAVDKLLDLELAIMLVHYQHDSEAKVVASERQRRLEQVAALQTLCAGLAHEVRNPLNSAKLQLELAERRARRTGDETKLVEPVELANHEIDRLTKLLDEFLTFARPAALDAHPHDVFALVSDIVDHVRPLAVRRGAELVLDAHSEAIVADIDSAKIQQVITSLVHNALEAVTRGGRVSVAVLPVDGHAHIRVTDDGPGIPSDVLPRIYEPFFSTKEGGTGMGMSIAHSLVALHHGTIEVATSSRGTTFDVALPRSQPATS